MKFNNRSRLNQGASQQLSTRGVPAAQEEHPPLKLATAYVPPQPYTKQFSPEEALKKGTLWPELYTPYPPPNPR